MRSLWARYFPVLCVLLYLVSPIDLVADVLPVIGWMDDLLLLGTLIFYLTTRLPGESPHEFLRRMWLRYGRSARPREAQREQSTTSETPEDPHTLLGVRRTASPEEIKVAYRKAVALYHPDKVAHLGPELKELAHKKLLALQNAYDTLMKGRQPS